MDVEGWWCNNVAVEFQKGRLQLIVSNEKLTGEGN